MSAYTAVLCDDESSIVEELSMAVRWDELGIEIAGTASTGKEALNLILEKKPDIAVMDIRMPDMSGLEVMKQARESGLTTDFIILSGYNEFNYAREAIRVGAKAYLLKPLNITELYDELCHICADRAGHKPNAAYIKKLTENFIRNLIGGHIMSRDSLENMLATTGTVLHNGSSYCVCISWKNPILRSSAESTRILHVIESHAWKDPHFFLAYSENQIVGVCNCGAAIRPQIPTGFCSVSRRKIFRLLPSASATRPAICCRFPIPTTVPLPL
ncbi:MAG: response regulator [Lachnospiraceae bacterium]|nr:response regulator [Lachnospiraceae bacterium]